MGNQNNSLDTVLQQIINSRQAGADAKVIGGLAVFYRYIVVHADEDDFVFDICISNSFHELIIAYFLLYNYSSCDIIFL